MVNAPLICYSQTTLFDNLADIERELLQVRTSENAANKGQIVTFVPTNLLGRRVRDSNSR